MFAGIAILPVVAACNALLGIDDYERVTCTGGVCDGGLPIDGPSEADRPNIVLVDAAGAGPVSWARFKMPNDIYDAGPDGKVDNPMAYDAAVDGLVDQVTKLVWQEPAFEEAKTFADAQKACRERGGWRVPTRIELVTLLDMSGRQQRTSSVFAGPAQREYWTSSEVRPYPAEAAQRWTVNFRSDSNDVLGHLDETNLAGVRCVKDQ